MVGPFQISVVTTLIGVGRCQLSKAKCTDKGDHSTKYPDENQPSQTWGIRSNDSGHLEDTGSNDGPNNDADAIKQCQNSPLVRQVFDHDRFLIAQFDGFRFLAIIQSANCNQPGVKIKCLTDRRWIL